VDAEGEFVVGTFSSVLTLVLRQVVRTFRGHTDWITGLFSFDVGSRDGMQRSADSFSPVLAADVATVFRFVYYVKCISPAATVCSVVSSLAS